MKLETAEQSEFSSHSTYLKGWMSSINTHTRFWQLNRNVLQFIECYKEHSDRQQMDHVAEA